MSEDGFDTLDNAPTMPGEQEGQILSGQYKIIRQIGYGGMGMVYLAQDIELDDKVAVKVLPTILANNKRAIDNLRKEAKTALKLSHHNIVRLRTFQSDEAIKYLVMEYIDGGSLEEKIISAGTLSVDETIEIFSQVAVGLDYAHSQNVLHRDIKPANIMLTKSGTAKLADFGIARQLKDSMTRITGKETSGTLLYMAPEQFRGGEPDHRSDIYSLAASIYESLSGKPPFWRGSIEYQIVNVPPRPLDKLSQKQNTALLKALSKEPGKRQNSAKELLVDLGADSKTINWQSLRIRGKKAYKGTIDYAKTISFKEERKPKIAMIKAFAVMIIFVLLMAGVFGIDKKYDLNHKWQELKNYTVEKIDVFFGAGKIWKNAEISAQKGDYDQAIDLLDKLITKYPDSKYTPQALAAQPEWEEENAKITVSKGDYTQAIELLDKLIAKYPNTEYAKWALATKPKWEKDNAIMVAQKGDYAQAIKLLDKIRNKYPNTEYVPWAVTTKPAWKKEYAKILFQKGDYAQAINQLDDLIAEYPNTEYAKWALATKPEWEDKKQITDLLSQARDLISKEQFNRASDCVEKVLKIDTENEEAKKLQAVIGREQQFRAFLRDGNDAETLREWEKAIEAYNQALKIKPNNIEVKDKLDTCNHNIYLSKAEAAQKREAWEEAIANYKKALEYKDVPDTRAKLIVAEQEWRNLQEYLKWIREAQRAEKDAEKNAEKEGSLPALYTTLKCYEEAQKYTNKSLKEKIESLKSQIAKIEKQKKFKELLSLAIEKYNKKQCEEASAAIKDAIDLFPDNQEAIFWKNEIASGCSDKIITNSIGMKLVLLPVDKFIMGSPLSEERTPDESPQHEVKISKRLYIGVYEVTQKQFKDVTGRNPSDFRGNDNLPVEQVSWNDANEFCMKLSLKEQKKGGYYRLPTEAEWEYACRAGTDTAFNNRQNGLQEVRKICWCSYDGRPGGARRTKPVGSFTPNTWGLYDMSGNVWEWCQDWYDENYYSQSPSVDPHGPDSGQYRVLRGGSWYDTPKDCRSAKRYYLKPDNSRDRIGFRVVFEMN
ncbi:MAG: SUMF1/EgtB/PvdO family nonheme iron enzyme [Phycisphaerae bacterium]|jgi:formylglycine-generating enzyme required for sulfatase activity/serine/threonine protein kinase